MKRKGSFKCRCRGDYPRHFLSESFFMIEFDCKNCEKRGIAGEYRSLC